MVSRTVCHCWAISASGGGDMPFPWQTWGRRELTVVLLVALSLFVGDFKTA